MKSLVAPVLTIALDEASSIISIVFRWIGSMMQFGPGSSEQILSVQGIRFSYLGLHSQQVVGGISEDEDSCFEVSLNDFKRYLIHLYQFPVHGDREQKIDYYLTAG